MTDLEYAIQNLGGHSICLCKDGKCISDDGKGLSPMIKFISEEMDLSGYSAADVIVGKAAAMLFAKAGVTAVYGKVMSKSAADFLEAQAIQYSFETLTDKIINRLGTDTCPMEKVVEHADDPDQAYISLKSKLDEMRITIR